MKAAEVFRLINMAILDHKNEEITNISDTFSNYIYNKTRIDCKQWFTEDEIRQEKIPEKVQSLKAQIDKLNSQRTEMIEKIDDYIVSNYIFKFQGLELSSETIGWLIDRMSILSIRIYHMSEQLHKQKSIEHSQKCMSNLTLLMSQYADLTFYYDRLMEGILNGTRGFKMYKQIKMYNDPSYGDK